MKNIMKENAKEMSKKHLLELIKPGDTVFTQVTSVARSGMSRWIKLMLIINGEPYRISLHVGNLLGYRHDPDKGLHVSGCGMDMCFNTVYNLGRVLFPSGFPIVEPCDKCQDRPGFNGLGKPCKTCKGSGMKPAYGRNGDMSGWDTDGGYALKYRTL